MMKTIALAVLLATTESLAKDLQPSMLPEDNDCPVAVNAAEAAMEHCHLYLIQNKIQARSSPRPIEEATCRIWGDPHVAVFDHAPISYFRYVLSLFASPVIQPDYDAFEAGDFWLARTLDVRIQGRYNEVKKNGHKVVYLRAIAIGGRFLHHYGVDNTLHIDFQGKVFWNENQILQRATSEYSVKHLINATRLEESPLVQDPSRHLPGFEFELPSKVKLLVNQGKHGLGVAITMPPAVGGHYGQCGNFNGNNDDDSAELIASRRSLRVPKHESLFKHRFTRHNADKASTSAEMVALQSKPLPFSLENVLYSNLAGAGPDLGSPREIRYHNVTVDSDGEEVDMIVRAESSYKASDVTETGVDHIVGQYGQINLQVGSSERDEWNSVDLVFEFTKTDKREPVTIPEFDFTVFDLHSCKGNHGKQRLTVLGFDDYYYHPEHQLEFQEKSDGSLTISSQIEDSGESKPTSLFDLTPSQQKVAVTFRFQDTHSFNVKYEAGYSSSRNCVGRNFLFGGPSTFSPDHITQ